MLWEVCADVESRPLFCKSGHFRRYFPPRGWLLVIPPVLVGIRLH